MRGLYPLYALSVCIIWGLYELHALHARALCAVCARRMSCMRGTHSPIAAMISVLFLITPVTLINAAWAVGSKKTGTTQKKSRTIND